MSYSRVCSVLNFAFSIALILTAAENTVADALRDVQQHQASERPQTNSTATPVRRNRARKASNNDQGNASSEAAAAFPEFDYTPNVVYKQVDDRRLELDILTPKSLAAERAPALVYIHGGGWAGGDRYRMRRPDIAGVFHRCGSAGIICVSIEYRLNDERVTAFDCAVDCKDALRFLAKNADKYRIDPARIATIGGSAGGHLSLVAALGEAEDFPGDPQLAGHDPALRCEVAYYPATDFTDIELVGRFMGPRAKLMFGGPPEEKADLIRILSPVHLIRKDSTPVLCFHGDRDGVLPVEHSRRLFAKGKAVGADIRYTEVKNAPHGFGRDGTPSIEEICDQASEYVIGRLKR
ncbi:MAG: alpha/beta hydrolase [Planctomycetaceae bacterium]|nr:alpha/beta hydrolase [Planctomycetaceae bacterium]